VKPAYKPIKELVNVTPGSEEVAKARDYGLQRYGTSKLLQMMTGNEVGRMSLSHIHLC
jgi:hypothetical protein